MNAMNKLTVTMLSVALMAGLTACNGSLSSDSKKKEKLTTTEQGKVEPSRKYLISHVGQSGKPSQVSFELKSGRFGNGKVTVEGSEYKITDECSDTSCTEVGALITKVQGIETEQSAYLFKLVEGKFELVCSVKGTKMQEASEAFGIEGSCLTKNDIVSGEDADETL